MANREKYMRDLVRDWNEGHDNTIPSRVRSSRVIGTYIKNRRADSRGRPSVIVFDERLHRSGLRPVAANAPPEIPLSLIPMRLYGSPGRRRVRAPRRELRRKPQGRRGGYRC